MVRSWGNGLKTVDATHCEAVDLIRQKPDQATQDEGTMLQE